MSGPKTSHISIQEQIRQRLALADRIVSVAISAANAGLGKQRDRVASGSASLTALGDSNPAIMSGANGQYTQAQAKLQALAQKQAGLRSMAAIGDIEAEAQRIAAEAEAIAAEAEKAMQAYEQQIQDSLRKAERSSKASDFAQMLKGALDAVPAAEMSPAPVQGEKREASRVVAATHQATVTSWDEIAATVGDAVRRYTQLMARPEYLTASTARVLVEHGASFLDAVEGCSEDADRAQLTAASNYANLMLELLPAYEREADAMRDVLAANDELESALPCVQKRPSSFATLDDAEQYLEGLRQVSAAYADQRYIQSCIDDVMRRHGYDIARSVSLERSAGGENLIFGMEGADDGIHVFVNDKGDMMMEAVGVDDVSEMPEDATVSLVAADEGEQAQFLLEVQEGFCSVYAEIESELAEYGISIKTVNRCVPDLKYSKEVRMDAASDEAKSAAPPQTKSAPDRSRRRRRSTSRRERAL